MTAFKDVAGLLVLAFLLPLWMALGFGALVVLVARQLYWWTRGNTSAASRVPAPVTAWLSRRTRRASPPDPLVTGMGARGPGSPAPVPVALQ